MARALAIDAQDLLLLRRVDQMEISAVRAQQPKQGVEVERTNARFRLLAQRIVIVGCCTFAQQAQLFYQLKNLWAALLRDHAAEQVAQQIDVFA